jgi:pimeloyl-ACP methyl ester carboxylesterase
MYADLGRLTIAYDRAGSGPPVLWLHGYPLSRRIWRPQLEGLPDAADHIAPDLRGQGDSGGADQPYTLDTLADDAVALLDELGVAGPAVVAGLSMGGYAALALYRRHPQRVAGLILAATRAGADSADGRAGRDRTAALAREKGVDAIVESMLPKMLAPRAYTAAPELVDEVRGIMVGATVPGIVQAQLAMKERPDSTVLLEHIACPVLVLHGADDQLIAPAEAEAMHLRLRRSRLQLIPNAGHLPNMEQPASFNAEVRTFLEAL